jgi:hypothetical protein
MPRKPPEGGSQTTRVKVSEDRTLSLEPLATPYGDGLALYQRAGWPGVIPLNRGKKTPAARGVTGRRDRDGNPSHWPTADEYDTWAKIKAKCNLGLRMPEELIALDVDDYTGKRGGETLAKLETELGPLPPAWRSTSRRDGSRSGCYLYRVPVGLKWPGVIKHTGTSDIEIIHAGLRTVACWPSIHKTGAVYGWFRPDGQESDQVPPADPAEHPELPDAWVEYLTGGRLRDTTATAEADLGDAHEWLTDGEPCPAVRKAMEKYGDGSRHDTARDLQVALLRLGEQGHQGVKATLEELETAFVADLDDESDRDGPAEWAGMLAGAPRQIRSRTKPEDRGCCPVEVPEPAEDDVSVVEPDDELAQATVKGPVAGNDPTIHSDGRRRFQVDVPGYVTDQLRKVIGTDALAGIFRRSGELVYTPRIGETGYIKPKNPRDHDGPAQVRLMTPELLLALVDVVYACGYWELSKDKRSKSWRRLLPPLDGVKAAVNAARLDVGVENVKELLGTTHTPVLRPDGTVLDQPGYDESTGLLYLPDRGLTVPPIPDRPSTADIKAAVALVGELVADFPFISEDHRANWLGMLLTPLLRPLLPPPYQMGVFTAPNPGSGKTLLAWIIGSMHGRVMRGDLPRDAEELRKALAALLLTTTAPVVTFDNVRGVVRSSVLEGLLTTDEWSDRILGKSKEMPTLRNDRLWLLTSNNAALGGDLARRILPVEIDPGIPNPERRPASEFRLPNIKQHVRDHRGALLAAMLTIARGWVLDDQPSAEPTGDEYATWTAGMAGLITWARFDQAGVFGGTVESTIAQDPDADEAAELLATIHRTYRGRSWTVKELAAALTRGIWDNNPDGKEMVDPDALPSDLADRFTRCSASRDQGFKQSLGWWFKGRAGRYAHGWKVEKAGGNAARQEWRVVPPAGLVEEPFDVP